MNVRINLSGLEDKAFAEDRKKRGAEILEKAKALETEIVSIVENKIA
jgi:formiminotetrahydrofolate cyclodeaminase